MKMEEKEVEETLGAKLLVLGKELDAYGHRHDH